MSVQDIPTIDPASEVLIPVSRMAKERLGKRLSPSTLHRWLRKGVRGAVLPAVGVGGVWHTTRAAWAWWIEAQTQEAIAPRGDRHAESVTDEQLEAAGLL